VTLAAKTGAWWIVVAAHKLVEAVEWLLRKAGV
jgi:hypothetical protein